MSTQASPHRPALTSTSHLIIRETLKNDQNRDREPQELEHQQMDPEHMEPQGSEQEKDHQEPSLIRYVPAIYASLMVVGATPILQGALSLPGPTVALLVLMFILFHFVSLKERENDLKWKIIESQERSIGSLEQQVQHLKQHVQLLEEVNQLLQPQYQENRASHRQSMQLLRQENARLKELYARRVRMVEELIVWMSDDEEDDL